MKIKFHKQIFKKKDIQIPNLN